MKFVTTYLLASLAIVSACKKKDEQAPSVPTSVLDASTAGGRVALAIKADKNLKSEPILQAVYEDARRAATTKADIVEITTWRGGNLSDYCAANSNEPPVCASDLQRLIRWK